MLTPALILLGAVPADTVPLYDNLGAHHYAITTSNPLAQKYFDQGLRLYYAFNHAEAIRAFGEAQRLDPACAMCFWGEALAWGPNINLPMDSASGVAAHAAAARAMSARGGAAAHERALIEALSVRYAAVPPADRAGLDSAYAQAMAGVARQFPSDNEVLVLQAEALMDLRPWNYWTAEAALQSGMDVALRNLERVIAADPDHPGACHFYIHAVEAAYPERAVPCAERLAGLMPGAGHLVHMPGHIYIRVGRYTDAITANEHAVHADESYIQDQRPGMGVYTAGYYPHNYDFMAFAAAMAGRKGQALMAADKLAELATPMLGQPGMDFTQHHATRRLQYRVWFERWDELLAAPDPGAGLPHAQGIWLYARGRALVATGNLAGAHADLASLKERVEDPRVQGMRLEFNESQDVLAIAAEVLAGRLAEAEGRVADAERHLREAARREAALTYGEPPDWSRPVHQELGLVRLATGRAADAETAFRADLKRFPANGWSLDGLARALAAQGRTDDAQTVRAELAQAWAGADKAAGDHQH